MISVQNLRLQLSGNKLKSIFVLMCLTIGLSSCSIFKHTPQKPSTTTTTKTEEEKKETKEQTEVKNEEIKTDETGHATDPKKKEKKDSYEIAYVLPFSVDEQELNQLMGEEQITGYQPLAAIEFYEGSLMALDTLKKMGLHLTVSVYDNKKDSLSTALLLSGHSFKTTDLIIGPVFNESLKASAVYAKENQVYVLSPLSPSSNITSENQYFLMANSTLLTQLATTIEFASREHQTANFIVVYRNEKENEKKIAAEFKTAFDAIKITHPGITYKEVYSYSGISAGLNTSDNFIFIASNEELYVNSLIRDLSKISREKNITLLGLQSILTFESVSLDYFENLQLHFPTAYWVDQDLQRVKAFNKAFTNQYDIKPSEYAYRGYDLTLYFGALLMNYGPALADNFGQINSVAPFMLSNFNFKPCISGEQIKFYENENISIVKYEHFKFAKVN